MADTRGAGHNIYTVLAFIAFLALLFGVAYVLYRYNATFGGTPFTASLIAGVTDATTALSVGRL